MKKTVDLLSARDVELLAAFYNTDMFRAMRRFIDIERLEHAKDVLNAPDMLYVKYKAGQAHALKELILEIQRLGRNREKKADEKAKKVDKK